MAAQGDSVIGNPRSGERVEFVSETPEVLAMLTTWTRPGHRAAGHIHPDMEERFEVLEGRAAFAVDGIEVVAAADEVVVARPGSRHLAWNPADAPVRLKIEMRPGLRWAEFTRRFFRVMIQCSSSANTAPRSSSRRNECSAKQMPSWTNPGTTRFGVSEFSGGPVCFDSASIGSATSTGHRASPDVEFVPRLLSLRFNLSSSALREPCCRCRTAPALAR